MLLGVNPPQTRGRERGRRSAILERHSAALSDTYVQLGERVREGERERDREREGEREGRWATIKSSFVLTLLFHYGNECETPL